jgi:hypothetical protein
MSLPLSQIQDAAFWHQYICLGCSSIQSDSYDAEEPCEVCDREPAGVLDAQLILRCLAFVEDGS